MRLSQIICGGLMAMVFVASNASTAQTLSRVIDVTEKVSAAVQDGQLSITANVETLSDPAQNQRKILQLEYTLGEKHFVRSWLEDREIKIVPPQGQTLKIVKAYFGPIRCPVDVTDLIQKVVEDNALKLFVDHQNLGDPAPYIDKRLWVVYKVDGELRGVSAAEHSEINIAKPDDGKKMEIVYADFGPWIPQFDVTDILTSYIAENKLAITVNTALFGSPGNAQQRKLTVTYKVGPTAHDVTVEDNEKLELPADSDGAGDLIIVKAAYSNIPAPSRNGGPAGN